MQKNVIPAVLAATVLVAGIFAFIPIEKASTVHQSIIGNRIVATYVSLDAIRGTGADFGTGTKIDLLDLSHTDSSTDEGHVVLALPSAATSCATDAGADTGLEFRIGNVRTPEEAAEAGVDAVRLTTNLLTAVTNTHVVAGPPTDWDNDGTVEAVCFFHIDLKPGIGGLAANVPITDHVLGVFGAGRILPDEAHASISVKLKLN